LGPFARTVGLFAIIVASATVSHLLIGWVLLETVRLRLAWLVSLVGLSLSCAATAITAACAESVSPLALPALGAVGYGAAAVITSGGTGR
jgi:hypothetical protein